MQIFIAMLKKDLKVLMAQRQILLTMTLVPAILSILMPGVLVYSILATSDVPDDLATLFLNVPADIAHLPADIQQLMILLDSFMPGYFLMIPILCGSVLAAGSFVTEREHKTMESLFYTPLSAKQLLSAKLVGALIPALAVSWIAALLTGLTVNLMCWSERRIMPFPTSTWWLIIFWLLPIVAALGLSFSVLVSSKARSYQEAQQKSAMLVLPLVVLSLSTALGGITMSINTYFILGLVLLVADIIMIHMISLMFRPETMI